MRRPLLSAVLAAACSLGVAGVAAADDGSTCSNLLGYPHGYHILADYVTGLGSEFLGGPGIEWPISGGAGQYIAGDGAYLPGGPGPGFHFVIGAAPGASFCTDSQSPGFHL